MEQCSLFDYIVPSYLLAYFVCPPSVCAKACRYNFPLSQSYYVICHFLFSIRGFLLKSLFSGAGAH